MCDTLPPTHWPPTIPDLDLIVRLCQVVLMVDESGTAQGHVAHRGVSAVSHARSGTRLGQRLKRLSCVPAVARKVPTASSAT
jgi:hypothetical protein